MKNSNFSTVEKAKILVVEDNVYNSELLTKILSKQEYDVRCVSNGYQALKLAQSGWAEIILLDIQMPEMSGYEVCRRLKTNQKTQEIPVIFLSALDDTLDKIKGFQVGGVDYITKPFQPKEILIRVENQLKIKKKQNTVQSLNEKLEENIKQRTLELEAVNQQLTKEIQQRQQAQDKLLKLALHDTVTGLPNRNAFLGELKQLLSKHRQKPDEQTAILLINYSLIVSKNRKISFPEIKSYLDHLALNQLSIAVANRLQSCFTDSVILSRFEDNVFAAILPIMKDATTEVMGWVEVINHQFQRSFTIRDLIPQQIEKNQKLTINCHMGIVVIEDFHLTPNNILHNGEIAVYQAQKSTERNYHFFRANNINKEKLLAEILDRNSNNLALAIKQLRQYFKEAFKNKEIELIYRPIFSLNNINNLEPKGLEVISNQKIIALEKFIKDIDKLTLNTYLSNFTLNYACYYLKKLQQQHETQQNFFLVMRFTKEYLLQSQLVSKLESILTKIKLNPRNLHMDIIGHDLMFNNKQILNSIQELSQLGITLNFEYFDLPYETLKNLSKLPFHDFKIPSSMTAQITNPNKEKNSQITIAKAINVAHAHQMSVTAKGITTQEQLDYLKSVGCNYGQGDLLSKPLDMESLETFLVWRL